MTIFGRRIAPIAPQMCPPHKFSAETGENLEAQACFDDSLFADINWPDDLDETSSLNNAHWIPSSVSTRGSDPDDDESSGSIENCAAQTCVKPYSSPDDGSRTESLEEPTGSSAKSQNCRFSKEVRSILRTWYYEHRDNPYPSSAEKDDLVARTKLKRGQISLWLANTRRKNRSRKEQDVRCSLPPTLLEPFKTMNPLQRWKVTPIETEYTPAPIILAACEDSPPKILDSIDEDAEYAPSVFEPERSTTNMSHFDTFWAQSMASYETGLTSATGTSISGGTAFSYPSFTSSLSSCPKHDRRRRRCHTSKATKLSSKDRYFHCTFCPNSSFATKHDWQRHEKSQHLSLEKWTCCLNGGAITTPHSSICAFCDESNPSPQHLEIHNYSACQVKELNERTFYRKDHFQQHLRLTHDAKFNTRMEAWKTEITEVASRCGFCSAIFSTWSSRADHLAAHFKCRSTMRDWVGGLGLEPQIASMVERATMPALGQELTSNMAKFSTTSLRPPPPLFPQLSFPDIGTASCQQSLDGIYPSFDALGSYGNVDGTWALDDSGGIDLDMIDWTLAT